MEDEESVCIWGISEQVKYKNMSIVMYSNEQALEVTGSTSVHDSRHQEARRKQRRTTWRELRVARLSSKARTLSEKTLNMNKWPIRIQSHDTGHCQSHAYAIVYRLSSQSPSLCFEKANMMHKIKRCMQTTKATITFIHSFIYDRLNNVKDKRDYPWQII